MFCGGSSTFNALRIAPTNTVDFVPVTAVQGIPAQNFNGSTYQVIGNTVTVILKQPEFGQEGDNLFTQ